MNFNFILTTCLTYNSFKARKYNFSEALVETFQFHSLCTIDPKNLITVKEKTPNDRLKNICIDYIKDNTAMQCSGTDNGHFISSFDITIAQCLSSDPPPKNNLIFLQNIITGFV